MSYSKNKNLSNTEEEVGDIRVSFSTISCGPCSIISCQEKNSFIPFAVPAATSHVAEHNRILKDVSISGVFGSIFKRVSPPLEELEWITNGEKNKQVYFKEVINERFGLREMWRFLSWVLLLVGIFTLFGPIYYVSNNMPLVGGIVGMITKIVGFLFSFIFATAMFCLIIAIIWLFYLPIVSAIFVLLAVALLLFYFLI